MSMLQYGDVSNVLNDGMDKIKDHSIGRMGIFGEEPDLKIRGVFIIRGKD